MAEALAQRELIYNFFTCIALFPGSPFYSISQLRFLKDFQKRAYVDALMPYTKIRPFKELMRLGISRIGRNKLVAHEKGLFSVDMVYKDLDLYVAKHLKKSSGVYAYEDGAFESFKIAKKLGLKRFYELPIGYWRAMHQILQEEKLKEPDWAATLSGLKDSERKLKRKDEELGLADRIIVASSFTAETLKYYPGPLPPIHVIPYGFPPVRKTREYTHPNNTKLKVLFVGSLSQRKGISYLFEAVNQLKKNIELTVIGQKPQENCPALDQNLKKHRWIPALSHPDILDLMRSQDILIFPSLFEGFGLVITEAMSQGTPVITTERTCGPDFINQEENGWLIEAGSVESLFFQLEKILSNPNSVKQVGKGALDTAKKRPWKSYGDEMSELISRIL